MVRGHRARLRWRSVEKQCGAAADAEAERLMN